MLAVRQPQPQVEVLPPMQRAEEVQLVQELHTLVQQVLVQEAADRGTAWRTLSRGGIGTERKCADMVQ